MSNIWKRPNMGIEKWQGRLCGLVLVQAGYIVNHKRVRRLMQTMGLEAIYPKVNTSKSATNHKIYPYLLRGMKIVKTHQVWATDITYVPMAEGYMYLMAVIDLFSRYVLTWSVSNTMDAEWCSRVLRKALDAYPAPEIFNTDQGSQFTSDEFTGTLLNAGIRISMDGKGRALDTIFRGRPCGGASLANGQVREYLFESVRRRVAVGVWFRGLF